MRGTTSSPRPRRIRSWVFGDGQVDVPQRIGRVLTCETAPSAVRGRSIDQLAFTTECCRPLTSYATLTRSRLPLLPVVRVVGVGQDEQALCGAGIPIVGMCSVMPFQHPPLGVDLA